MIYNETIGLSKEEYMQRIKRVQSAMADHNLDILLSYGDEGQYMNLYYLTRYWPCFEVGGAMLGRTGKPLVLIGGEAVEFGAMTPFGMESVRPCSDFGHRSGGVRGWLGVKFYDLRELMEEVAQGETIRRIGIPDLSILPYPLYQRILEVCPGVEIVDCAEMMNQIRLFKTEGEVALLRKASEISEKAFESFLGIVTPEMTELQAEGILIGEMLRLGGETPCFPQTCFSGYHTRCGIGHCTHKVLGRDQLITVGYGCRYGGYCGTYARPFMFGKMPDAMKDQMKFMLDLHEKIIFDWSRPGTMACDVYNRYYDAFVSNGHGEPPAGASHGIGVMEGDGFSFRRHVKVDIAPGMVIAADHYYRAAEYGFRFEDAFVVGEKENSVFTRNNWGFIEL